MTNGKGTTFFVVLILLAVSGIVFTVVGSAGTRKALVELQDKNRALADRVDVLGKGTETLIGERSRARLERNEARLRAAKSEETLADVLPRLEAALADLERVSKERDEHLDRRLYLERRLADTETALAVALRQAGAVSGD